MSFALILSLPTRLSDNELARERCAGTNLGAGCGSCPRVAAFPPPSVLAGFSRNAAVELHLTLSVLHAERRLRLTFTIAARSRAAPRPRLRATMSQSGLTLVAARKPGDLHVLPFFPTAWNSLV